MGAHQQAVVAGKEFDDRLDLRIGDAFQEGFSWRWQCRWWALLYWQNGQPVATGAPERASTPIERENNLSGSASIVGIFDFAATIPVILAAIEGDDDPAAP